MRRRTLWAATASTDQKTHNIYTFESEAGGTRVTLTDDIELSGIFGLFEPLIGRMVRRQYEANLGRLKAVLERRPPREPDARAPEAFLDIVGTVPSAAELGQATA